MSIPIYLLAAEFHDIAPPLDYSLIPPWVIALGVSLVLCLLGLIGWWIVRRFRRGAPPPPLPRDRALAELERASGELNLITPYQFSIRISDILRRYVSEQFGLPLTRQTSVEFLEELKRASHFSEEETQLLQNFLNTCDLIKFARYQASRDEGERLLNEAILFVKGGKLAHALA